MCRAHRLSYHARPTDPSLADGSVKRIRVAGGYYAYVDAADYEELSKYKWHLAGGKYAGRYNNGKVVLMHRQIMQTPAGMVTDHIDGNGMNNCRWNMRNCTRQENSWNKGKRVTAASMYKGVYRDKRRGKIFAKVSLAQGPVWLGYFDDEESAARVSDAKAVECFGEFAHLNFPDEWPPERRQQLYAQHPNGPERIDRRKTRRKKPSDTNSTDSKSDTD